MRNKFIVIVSGQTVTLVTDMRRESLTAHRNSVITYYEDGEIVSRIQVLYLTFLQIM